MERTTFAERIHVLKDMAMQLRSFAETIMIEAQHMEAVQSRFEQRVGKRVNSAQRSNTKARA